MSKKKIKEKKEKKGKTEQNAAVFERVGKGPAGGGGGEGPPRAHAARAAWPREGAEGKHVRDLRIGASRLSSCGVRGGGRQAARAERAPPGPRSALARLF